MSKYSSAFEHEIAGHPPVELQKGDDRAGEGQRTDRSPNGHLDTRFSVDRANITDAEGERHIECRSGNQHGGKTHQRVEAGNQLRHRCHRNDGGDIGAYSAGDRQTENDQHETDEGGPRQQQRRENGVPMPIMP